MSSYHFYHLDDGRLGKKRRRLQSEGHPLPLQGSNATQIASNPHYTGESMMAVSAGEATIAAVVSNESSSSAATTPFCTILILVLWHLLFLRQWNKRRKSKHVLVDYSTIVQRKRFHRLWLTLLSHPPSPSSSSWTNPSNSAQDQDTDSSSGTAEPNPSSRTIEMGNHVSTPEYHQQLVMSTSFFPESCYTSQLWLGIVALSKRLLVRFQALFCLLENTGVVLLLYNSHILWSCRALEEELGVPSRWNYLRILICWALLAFGMELALTHLVFQRFVAFMTGDFSSPSTWSRPRRPRSEENLDVIGRIESKLLFRPMGSPTVVTAAILSVFQFQYPYVAVSILPFVENPPLIRALPPLCYVLCLCILGLLSRNCHFVWGVVFGTTVGILWSLGWIDMFSQPYWNSCVCLSFAVVTLLSLKATSRKWAPFLPCIEHVAWDHSGRVLIQLDNGRWVPQTDDSRFLNGNDYEDGYLYSSSSDDDDDTSSSFSSTEDSPARAFPPSDDEEIYGMHSRGQGSTNDGDDDDDIERNIRPGGFDSERVPFLHSSSLSSDFINNVRSRRGNTGR